MGRITELARKYLRIRRADGLPAAGGPAKGGTVAADSPAGVAAETARSEAVQAKLRAGIDALGAQIPAPVPMSIEGINPAAWDADWRITSGTYSSGDPFPPQYDFLTPDSPFLLVSDAAGIAERSSATLRFVRPFTQPGYDFQDASPGSRVGFQSAGNGCYLKVKFNTRVLFTNDKQGITAAILVDGVVVDTIDRPSPYNVESFVERYVALGFPGTLRRVELVWPVATGMELILVAVEAKYAYAAAPARPGKMLGVLGASLGQGLEASAISNTWSYKLAAAKGYQLINMSRGGLRSVDSDATELTGLVLDVVIDDLGGYNDFASQVVLTTFGTACRTRWQEIRKLFPAQPILVQSAAWAVADDPAQNPYGPIQLQSYRDVVTSAFQAWADGNATLVDGLSLLVHNADRFTDAFVHFNDLGSSEVCTGYLPYVPAGDL